MLNRIELKSNAKAITKSARVSAYQMTLLYLVIRFVLGLADNYVSADEGTWVEIGDMQFQVQSLFHHAAFPTPVVVFVSVLVWLLGCVLAAGYVLYHQGVRRGEEMPISSLFDGFGFVGKIVLLNLVMTVFVALWSMLFIIPGIIAGYRYRFALYNLCENPEIGVMEALNMSKAQTLGFKWQLFVLDLSFIGWSLLASLTLGILYIWLAPYIAQSNIAFFQEIKKIKGVGFFPPRPEDDDQFRPHDPFGEDNW